MTDANRSFLDANRIHYETLTKAGYVRHLDGNTRSNMLRVIRETFAPNYLADLWCAACVADMVRFCYVQYDKWLKENKNEDL